MRFGGAVLGGILIFFAGCMHSTKTCSIAVNSFANPYAKTSLAYLVLPLNQGAHANDADFQEYSRYLGKALEARGYRAAHSFEEAQVAVFLGYGVGPPEKYVANYNVPVAGKVDDIPRNMATLNDAFGSDATVPADAHTKFTRYAIINAIDVAEYKAERRLVRVWSTRIVSVGNTGDLHAMFPVILAGAWDLLGANSGDVYRQVELNGEQVLWMKSAARVAGENASEPRLRVGTSN
jgi:hypothetical protein